MMPRVDTHGENGEDMSVVGVYPETLGPDSSHEVVPDLGAVALSFNESEEGVKKTTPRAEVNKQYTSPTGETLIRLSF